MSTQRESRAPLAPLRDLLPLMLMVAGLFLMHGLQASADPTEHTGITIAAAMPGVESAHPAVAGTRSGPQWSPSHGSDHHGHAGGQMCLALLSIATMLLLLAGARRNLPVAPPRGDTAPRELGRQGRSPPPPSIFELSVLRT